MRLSVVVVGFGLSVALTSLARGGKVKTIRWPDREKGQPALDVDVVAPWKIYPTCWGIRAERERACRESHNMESLVDCKPDNCPRVNVIGLDEMDPPLTLEKGIADTKLGLSEDGWRNLKTEKLKDGWVITTEGGEWGDTFPVKVRRDLGGQVLSCSGEANSRDRQREIVAACKSLRLAK